MTRICSLTFHVRLLNSFKKLLRYFAIGSACLARICSRNRLKSNGWASALSSLLVSFVSFPSCCAESETPDDAGMAGMADFSLSSILENKASFGSRMGTSRGGAEGAAELRLDAEGVATLEIEGLVLGDAYCSRFLNAAAILPRMEVVVDCDGVDVALVVDSFTEATDFSGTGGPEVLSGDDGMTADCPVRTGFRVTSGLLSTGGGGGGGVLDVGLKGSKSSNCSVIFVADDDDGGSAAGEFGL